MLADIENGNIPLFPYSPLNKMQKHKTKVKIVIAILLLIIFALFGYFYNKGIPTNKPDKQYAAEIENTIVSNLALAIKLDLKNLNKQIDELIPKKNYFSHSESGCIKKLGLNIDCKVKGYFTKSGDISISTTKNNIQFKVPIYVHANASAGIVSETAKIYLDLIFKLNQKISPDWKLSVDDIDIVLNDCYIRILGIKISICGMIKKPLQREVKKLNIKFSTIDIQKKVQEVWKYIHRVDKISSKPDIYLAIEPKTLSFSGLNVVKNTLIANIALNAKLNIITGYKPYNPKYTELPSLGTNTKNGFSIALPIRVPYNVLKKELEKQLIDKDWRYLGNVVVINDIEIYPASNNIVIGIHFKADTLIPFFDSKGVVYFYGKPVIDIKNKAVRIQNFKLISNTNNDLIDVLGFVTSKITKLPIYNFASDYKKLIDAIEKPLTFNKIQLNIKVNEQSIKFKKLHLLKDDMYINAIVKGKAELIILE